MLNNDHALHTLLGTRELPSPDAAGDWLRRTGETGLPGLGLLRDTINAWYNQRNRAENLNKEVKSGFGLERMPCGTFKANAVFFRLGIIAYNLY